MYLCINLLRNAGSRSDTSASKHANVSLSARSSGQNRISSKSPSKDSKGETDEVQSQPRMRFFRTFRDIFLAFSTFLTFWTFSINPGRGDLYNVKFSASYDSWWSKKNAEKLK